MKGLNKTQVGDINNLLYEYARAYGEIRRSYIRLLIMEFIEEAINEGEHEEPLIKGKGEKEEDKKS